ncbi:MULTISPECIES: hypothetical protein [unclassified Synechocystis]|nr:MULTISPECIES: hypothetical protein [unclassified Synechocystis]MBD2640708.1 hypothetical protein [Synechocystis sp. FACHB-908]MBD2662427.1 hypothetical protein [Synechocystis sp. FACHB-929]NHM00085.1 hypothetical protein [Synechocystis sp. PCC 6803]QWO82604.1 hypothetical protein KBZ93_18400 [Synechocystis sp. PCC 6803]
MNKAPDSIATTIMSDIGNGKTTEDKLQGTVAIYEGLASLIDDDYSSFK